MNIKPIAMAALMLLPVTAPAAGGGMAGHGMKMDGDMKQMFLEKRQIDGYSVSFHVMPASQGMQHGGSHNFMIKVEKNGKVLTGIPVNSKVIGPDGKAASKMMMAMGDWYMAGYDLAEQGRSQLMVLFRTKNGSKHFGGVYYNGRTNLNGTE